MGIETALRPAVRPHRATTIGMIAATSIAPIAWGTTYAVTTQFLPAGHPLFASLLRSLPLGLLAIAFTRHVPRGSWRWKAPILGVLNIGAFFPLLFVAAEHLPGGVAATLGATQPLIVAGLSVLVLRESPSLWRIAWGVVGAVGVALVVLGPAARFDPLGIAAGLGGAVVMALGVTLAKLWGRPAGVGAATLAGWQLASGGLVLLPLALAVEGVPPRLDLAAAGGYAWLATVGGLFAYVLWFRGIGRLPITATALLGLLSPLVAALIGALLLGEPLAPIQSAGFGVALLALLAGQLSPGQRSRSAPPSPVEGLSEESRRAP
ncbi:EamA family transporter [Sinomonas sp. ASV322]|uniref:EamA family transporter n=1 Tax=Sinomonas sp. ASV322 TaxID=3041920 RepID=UPI0027DD4EA8|nr:EamA family transporter [Sinomonas sp. ASV322]MDQ4501210.1 EamA family transporter [Sinomonas sp. ASV322]